MQESGIYSFYKHAGAVNDNLASWLSLAYTPTLLTAMTSADAAVRASRQPKGATDKQIREFNKHPGWAWFPGQGLYRDMLREKRVMPGPRGEKHITAYTLSPAMSVLIGAIAGAGGGAAYGTYKGQGDRYLLPGIGIGAGAGLLAHIGGGLVGAMTPRRTKEDQKKYLESSTLPEWFIPGVGGYNAAKTLGLQIEDSDAVEAKRKMRKQAWSLFGNASAPKQMTNQYNDANAKRIRKIIADQFGLADGEVYDSQTWDDLNADDLDRVETIMSLEERFNKAYEDAEYEKARTVGDMVALFRNNRYSQPKPITLNKAQEAILANFNQYRTSNELLAALENAEDKRV